MSQPAIDRKSCRTFSEIQCSWLQIPQRIIDDGCQLRNEHIGIAPQLGIDLRPAARRNMQPWPDRRAGMRMRSIEEELAALKFIARGYTPHHLRSDLAREAKEVSSNDDNALTLFVLNRERLSIKV